MCELILAHLQDPQLNQLALSVMIQVGASAGNRHGTGFFFVDEKGEAKHWKTDLAGDSIMNLGKMIKSNATDTRSPLMAHVRDASKGIQVTAENAHPFEGERFILAHNGRLWDKTESASWSSAADNTGVSSDSKKYLESMEKVAKEKPKLSVLEIVNEAMTPFMGKFAFLFIDKKTGDYYVARGSSADLHFATIYQDVQTVKDEKGADVLVGKSPAGFLVQTKKASLQNALTLLTQIFQIVGTRYYNDSNQIIELKKNTLYRIKGKNLEEIGEFKETPVVWSSTTASSTAYPVSRTNFHNDDAVVNLSMPIWKLSTEIWEFLERHYLSIRDLDVILYTTLGKPLSEMSIDDMRDFVDLIPALSASNKTRRKVKNALGTSEFVYPYMYLEGMEFPWMLNDKKVIQSFIEHIRNIKSGKA